MQHAYTIPVMTLRNKGIFGWLAFDLIVFVAIAAAVMAYGGAPLTQLPQMSFFTLLVLGLASYRAANIVSTETITKPLRAPFVNEVEKEGKVVEKPKKRGFLGATGLLIYCPSCTGVWVSAAFVYAYLFWPVPTFLIALILALSAIERIISNVTGWFRSK